MVRIMTSNVGAVQLVEGVRAATSTQRGLALARAFVIVFPLLFVAVSWVAGAGLPYYVDSNETFLSYVHARNLELWDPWQYGWVTTATTDPEQPDVQNVYTHNPNGPRYLHYLLLKVGIHDIQRQTLILSLLGTALSGELVWRLFGRVAPLVALAFVVDYSGFLAWTVNTYRVWTFVLYFGLALAVLHKRAMWAALMTFLLFQVEYGMALYIGTTMATLALLAHGRAGVRLLAAIGIGGVASLAIFAAQVLAYYGSDGFVAELGGTYLRRGTSGQTMTVGTYLWQALNGMSVLLHTIGRVTHNWLVAGLTLGGMVWAPWMLFRGHLSGARRFVAMMLTSTTVGAVTSATVLHDFFIWAYGFSTLPMAVFLVAPALGLTAFEIRALIGRKWGGPAVALVIGSLVLTPLVVASIRQFRPPLAVDLIRRLETEYVGRSIVAPNFGPEFAFSLTGGRAALVGPVAGRPSVTADDLRQVESLRGADGTLTYLCLDAFVMRLASSGDDVPWDPHDDETNPTDRCQLARERLALDGHRAVAQGVGWSLIEVQLPATQVEGVATTR